MGWSASARWSGKRFGPLSAPMAVAAPQSMWVCAPAEDLNDLYAGSAVAEASVTVARGKELDNYVAGGVKGVRHDCSPGSAGYGWSGDWSVLDAVVAAHTARGLKLLLIFIATSTIRATFSSPSGRTAFVDWCVALATRYGSGHGYELMNEPNLESNVVSKETYVLILNELSPRLRAAVPAAAIHTGGLGPGNVTTYDGTTGHIASTEYAAYIFANAAPKSFDIFEWHQYCEGVEFLGHDGDSWHTKYAFNAVKTTIAGSAMPEVQIGIGEYGTNAGGSTTQDTEHEQYVMMRDMVDFQFADRAVADAQVAYMWSNRQAERTSGSGYLQDWYGMIRANGTPKKFLHKYKQYAALHNSAPPAFEVTKGTGTQTVPLWRWLRHQGDPRRLRLAFSAVSLPSGASISSDGVASFDTATLAAQLATVCQVKVRSLVTGAEIVITFTLTVQNPNLISNGRFDVSGNITGWSQMNANGSPSYDADVRALKWAVTGTGGGYQLTTPVTVPNGTVLEHGRLLRRISGDISAFNTFVDGLATTPASISIPTNDFEWRWVSYTTTDTAAGVSCTRNGATTGEGYTLEEILRVKL